MFKNKSISFVIPCCNEEEGLKEIIPALPGFVDEVLVVDNGSADNTQGVANRSGAKVIVEERRGYGYAIKAGLAQARGDIIVIFDGDGSYPINEIGNLLEYMALEQNDFVFGCRYPLMNRNSQALINRVANHLITFVIEGLFCIKLKDSQSGMFALKKEIKEKFQVKSNGMGFSQEIKIRAFLDPDLKCGMMHIPYLFRKGHSKFRMFKDSFLNLRSVLSLWSEYHFLRNKVFMFRPLLITVFSIALFAVNVYADLIANCGEINFVMKRSEIVVSAKVVDVQKDKRSTLTQIEAQRYIKGSGPVNLTVHSYGGTEMVVEDQPVFSKGESGYLFLTKNEDGDYVSVCGKGVVNETHPGFRESWPEVEKALNTSQE